RERGSRARRAAQPGRRTGAPAGPPATAVLEAPLRAQADRAGHPGAAQPAVTVGVLGQVLLVLVLGVIERRRGRPDLGGDGPVAGRVQPRLVGIAAGQRERVLLVVVAEDRRAVLGADVVALAHALGWIVVLPERRQQGLERHPRRVVHDQHHLGVPGLAAAHFAVGRVGRVAARVTGGGGHHPGHGPEPALHAPEAAHAELDPRQPLEAAEQRRAGDEVAVVQRHLLRTPGQGLARPWQPLLPGTDPDHGLAPRGPGSILGPRRATSNTARRAPSGTLRAPPARNCARRPWPRRARGRRVRALPPGLPRARAGSPLPR